MMKTLTVMPEVNNSRGYTLIEVLIAMLILSVGILATTKLQLSFMQSNAKSSIITTGSAEVQSMIEQLIDLPYDDPLLADTDGDGTGQDPNPGKNGVDNNGGNFGLDDIGAPPAADQGPVVRGRYTFYWNVALDEPANEVKTINVIVQWPDEKNIVRTVNYTFTKALM